MSASFTPGPWTLSFNSATAEPTRALGGKFKPRGHKSLNDYLLRVEVTGENVRSDAALIEAAPELYEGAVDTIEALKLLRLVLRLGLASDAKVVAVIDAHLDELEYATAKARGEQVAP